MRQNDFASTRWHESAATYYVQPWTREDSINECKRKIEHLKAELNDWTLRLAELEGKSASL